jgi:sigma-B regulation protein RsbU (phosphoserine phosphatase)
MIRASAKSPSPSVVYLSFEPSAQTTFAADDPRFEQLRKLTEISRALTYTTSLDEVTRLTVERGHELLDATATVLMLPDADGLMQVRSAHGISAALLDRFRAPLGDALIGRLRGLLSVPDECFIAVPLIVGGAVTGILAVATKLPSTPSDEWLLSALADQASVALENARVAHEVRVELNARLQASEGATDAKDRALSTLAHDIRTPLGAIDAYCSILEDELFGPVNDRQRETLGRVRMSGRHLLSLLDNVMEMARITAGAVRMELQPVRLIETARDAVQMLTPAADAKFQVLNFIDRDDVVVTADPARLRQVLVNLIGNAVKFTPADGVITVTVGETGEAGNHCGFVRVMDSGPGIQQSEQTAVFEPYYRSQVTAQAPGVGLGLAICVGLTEQMGGALSLATAESGGCVFSIEFPVESHHPLSNERFQ